MKLAVVSLITICVISIVSAQPQGYSTKYDNINVDQILHNDRLLKRYTDCLLERNNARCPPEAAELKAHLNEALSNECAKCSDKQKEFAEKVITYLTKNKREEWNELKAKYDPEGIYTKKYENLAESKNINI